jgi:hypothetical protein
MSKLIVKAMSHEDVWKDIARIPKEYRITVDGGEIGNAEICKVSVKTTSSSRPIHKLLMIRASSEVGAVMQLDSPTRVEMNLREGTEYEVELRRVGWLGYCKWACKMVDPAYRIPVQISVLSLLLGFIGLVLERVS